MSSDLDNFLEFLAVDGGWHRLDEVSASLQLARDRVDKIARFFARYNLVDLDKRNKRVRIHAKLRKFFAPSPEKILIPQMLET